MTGPGQGLTPTCSISENGEVRVNLIWLVALLLSSCSLVKKRPTADVPEAPPASAMKTATPSLKAPEPFESRGIASWYGRKLQHRRTASGERFNMYAFTAAHRTLPFGTKIRVRNLKTGKTVVVRVNDRGPSDRHRLIDVSYGAGRALGIVASGLTPVEIELLKFN